MKEIILNIFLIINDNHVVSFRAIAHEEEGNDESKIRFLKKRVAEDYPRSYVFDAPRNKFGNFMKYSKFARLEERGRQFELFEEIFTKFGVPEKPLICVTPVVDGKILSPN